MGSVRSVRAQRTHAPIVLPGRASTLRCNAVRTCRSTKAYSHGRVYPERFEGGVYYRYRLFPTCVYAFAALFTPPESRLESLKQSIAFEQRVVSLRLFWR